ncbi:MAG: laccase domain-containing protein [Phycisphaerales bacterium]|jgi:polyphenol oxidase|nr:laccase domain-containing protein [Phycisphaerales bacterium]MBT7170766.1 laccase domain-containing protein [Phycisphaerales bacterium]
MTDGPVILTEPSALFRFRDIAPGREVGEFVPLRKLSIPHGVTTRSYGEFPVAISDPQSAVMYDEFARLLGCERAAWVKQVHGGEILTVRDAGCVGEADGMVTDERGLVLLCRSADCPLILVAGDGGRVVGVAHASWRSTAAGIAGSMIERMIGEFGCDPAGIVACISPSAGPELYEVGQDVYDAMCKTQGPDAKFFFEPISPSATATDPKWLLDLWAANISQLQRAGVTFMNGYTARMCTIHRADLFPSYRRDGQSAGRFVAGIAAIL